jgi:hypothetical protein
MLHVRPVASLYKAKKVCCSSHRYVSSISHVTSSLLCSYTFFSPLCSDIGLRVLLYLDIIPHDYICGCKSGKASDATNEKLNSQ